MSKKKEKKRLTLSKPSNRILNSGFDVDLNFFSNESRPFFIYKFNEQKKIRIIHLKFTKPNLHK